ncbi:MAG: cytidylate kinase family protein [Tannerella sp.]|jgi:cytidylate kinase|nr:cytidylate kinase family protein [Tannerella sp.]
MTNNITITGDLGSGKSAVAALLKDRLKFEVVSVGMLQRQLAEKYKLNTVAFNEYVESHPEIDLELDRMVAETGKKNNLIFDSRLAWHFVENAFKVYLSVDDEIASRRIFSDKDRMNESYADMEQAKINIQKRRASELSRFKAQYHVALDDWSNYDLIIDTGYADPATVADCILVNRRLHLENRRHHKIWMSPESLIPARSAGSHAEKPDVSVPTSIRQKGVHAGEPVKVIAIDRKYYICEGCQRVAAACDNHVKLLPVEIIAGGEPFLPSGQKADGYVRENLKTSHRHD